MRSNGADLVWRCQARLKLNGPDAGDGPALHLSARRRYASLYEWRILTRALQQFRSARRRRARARRVVLRYAARCRRSASASTRTRSMVSISMMWILAIARIADGFRVRIQTDLHLLHASRGNFGPRYRFYSERFRCQNSLNSPIRHRYRRAIQPSGPHAVAFDQTRRFHAWIGHWLRGVSQDIERRAWRYRFRLGGRTPLTPRADEDGARRRQQSITMDEREIEQRRDHQPERQPADQRAAPPRACGISAMTTAPKTSQHHSASSVAENSERR